MKTNTLLVILIPIILSCQESGPQRQEISLNGTWEITKTDSVSEIPEVFSAKISVPGLIDMAVPSIDDQDTVYNSSIYWYRRTFTVDGSEC